MALVPCVCYLSSQIIRSIDQTLLLHIIATNLMHCAQFSSSFLKNWLRWHSDMFQMYLHNMFYVATDHTKALSLDITPPSPVDHCLLEPHEKILAALAAQPGFSMDYSARQATFYFSCESGQLGSSIVIRCHHQIFKGRHQFIKRVVTT
jgi:hypothetical protein